MKDRYNFDSEFNIEKLNTGLKFDEFYLYGSDRKIAERREARKAKNVKRFGNRAISKEEALAAKREKRTAHEKRKFVAGIFIIFAVLVVLAASGKGLLDLTAEKRAAQEKLKSLNEKAAKLENELTELNSDEYIENAARSELHMIKDGEVMYIVEAPEDEAPDGETSAK